MTKPNSPEFVYLGQKFTRGTGNYTLMQVSYNLSGNRAKLIAIGDKTFDRYTEAFWIDDKKGEDGVSKFKTAEVEKHLGGLSIREAFWHWEK